MPFVLAQDPFCINYSINDGLPSATVYSVSQDKNGFIWLSTDAGIVKYDSHHFTIINTDSGLSDNEVFQIKTDSKGQTWLLSLNGKACYIYQNKIYNETNSTILKKISGGSLMADFYEDAQKNCYLLYKNGEVAVLKPNNEVIKYTEINEKNYFGIWKKQDTTFLLTSNGVYNKKTNLTANIIIPQNHSERIMALPKF